MNRSTRRAQASSKGLGSRNSQHSITWIIVIFMVSLTTFASLIAVYYYGKDYFVAQTLKPEGIQSNTLIADQSHSILPLPPQSSSDQNTLQSSGTNSANRNGHLRAISSSSTTKEDHGSEAPLASSPSLSSLSTKVSAMSKSEHMENEKLPERQSRPQVTLISLNKKVISDVRGNLGPPSVITNERVEDWLQDRWQAAKNMQGEPIPGEHWLEVDLEGKYYVTKIVIDWEQAYSNNWSIMVRDDSTAVWSKLFTSKAARVLEKNKQHVIHEIPNVESSQKLPIRFVKLVIHRPSTMWGASVWRFQVWGYAV